MKSLTYVEIDIDRCSLTYGTAPCTASLVTSPVTGTKKCFNSLATCQDIDNFDDDGVTIRFGMDVEYLPADIECIPCLVSVDYSPATVSLGEDLGQRASIKVVLRDHRDSDTGPHGDKYLSDRSYNPFTRGTFFGKFRARHPYIRGSSIRFIRGELGDDIGDMETRHFVVDSFDGPLPDGTFTITAKDPLKLADTDRAQAPVASSGYLASTLSAGGSSATLLPSGIGSEEYDASGYLAIGGKEIVSFTRSSDTLTITGRGLFGTEDVEHAAQSRVQQCIYYDGEDPADIIADLLENYAGIDSDFIPLTDWQAETDTYFGRLFTRLLCEPTSVAKLVSEIIQQAALAVWWDEVNQEIQLQVLRAVTTGTTTYDEDNTVENSIQAKDQPEKRISEVWTYFAQNNPLKSVDDPDNYASIAKTEDEETIGFYGSTSIRKYYAAWIPSGGRTTATRLNAIQIGRFKVPPRRLNWEVWRDGINEPQLGTGCQVGAWFLQDDEGEAENLPSQITRLTPEADRFKLEAEEMRFELSEEEAGALYVVIDANANNVNFRTLFDDIYPTPESGDTVRCIVSSGVIVGSVSTSLNAFEVGSWPSGVTVEVEVNGSILGKGGAGGTGGGAATGGPGQAGFAGGPAFYTRQNITLSGTGVIGGGGGGGGGGGVGVGGGGGGGAGQGQTASSGGASGGGGANAGSDSSASAPGTGNSGANGGGQGANGGSLGSAGSSGGSGTGGFSGGSAGAAGVAVDGDSYITDTSTITYYGSQVN